MRFHFDQLGDPEAEYAVHVHQYGDISHDCSAIGKHYDPYIEDRLVFVVLYFFVKATRLILKQIHGYTNILVEPSFLRHLLQTMKVLVHMCWQQKH